jgi:hypothetical protein
VLYVGESQRASMMPVGGKRFYYFFGAPMPEGSTVEPDQIRDELATLFAGWPKPVQTLIQALDPAATNRLEICDMDPIETLVRGRVALLGMPPTPRLRPWVRGGARPLKTQKFCLGIWCLPISAWPMLCNATKRLAKTEQLSWC